MHQLVLCMQALHPGGPHLQNQQPYSAAGALLHQRVTTGAVLCTLHMLEITCLVALTSNFCSRCWAGVHPFHAGDNHDLSVHSLQNTAAPSGSQQ
jgi:hypothetical protein